MMKFLPTLGLCLALWTGANAAVPVSGDTLARPAAAPAFRPDTLLDLNRQLGGIQEITVPKGVVIPEAVEITPKGQIILKSDEGLKSDSYDFELKAVASDKEVYIVSVKIRRNGDKLVVSTVSDKIDMATGFRAEGKIYVVVAVSLILFITLTVYLLILDRRLRRLNARIANRTSH